MTLDRGSTVGFSGLGFSLTLKNVVVPVQVGISCFAGVFHLSTMSLRPSSSLILVSVRVSSGGPSPAPVGQNKELRGFSCTRIQRSGCSIQ